ncbi:DNA cytosine methyltransferase [Ralstonia sp.]|uniref:DNA cytosine methyltransferase n=1 Tax=Ralstonia sp. TaxID=54061 RepID=UPI002579BE20|nr:DNA cytosine methyltransferase [Ralstonia sp.]MBA4203216.1 DNA cytosine methyltransferase [Ralstonia sp.]
MRFGSICSGIEAASVAWGPLGWKAAWFSEIDPFACAVLAHHYPQVPNLGDMTRLALLIRLGLVEAPDVLCGGTPCQAFSVAGLRKSLDDARGNLSLTFCEIANAIDDRRTDAPPAVIFWENVPGVLSTGDNAFGCFLAGLAGEDDPLVAAGGKWTNAGAVYGPRRAVAWRVLDAQYFGLAQRRRRVFVVASARNDFDPAQVLFEWDGVRRDSAPSREAGEDSANRAALSVALRGREGGATAELGDDTASCLRASGGGGDKPHALVPARVPPIAMCLNAGGMGRIDAESETLIPFDTTQITCAANYSRPQSGDPCHRLAAGAHQPAIAFQPGNIGRGAGAAPSTEVFPTLKADHGRTFSDQSPHVAYAIQAGALRTNPSSGPDGVGVQADHAYTIEARAEVQAVAVALRGREGGATAELGDEVQNCLRASGGGGDKPHVLAPVAHARVAPTLRAGGNQTGGDRPPGTDVDTADSLLTTAAMQVRRLTPRECERLQGFPDDYTLIPWRKKPADECPDGPRYKALGNSWAVPNVRWIGARIAGALAR